MDEKKEPNGFGAKLAIGVSSAVVVAIVAFFVWIAHLAGRISTIEETRIVERDASRRVEDANRESLQRIEHEREANDARVRDDLRELRAKVCK